MDTLLMISFTLAMLAAGCLLLYKFFSFEKNRRIEVIKNWLLLVVVQAEKELGSGTGQIKLRYVYDQFLQKFKFMSMIITFEQFSALVDETLSILNNMLVSNINLQNYITGGHF